MDFLTAIRVLGIEDIGKVDSKELKKLYKKLMIANHPDLGGSNKAAQDINSAYEVASKMLSSIKTTLKSDTFTCIITIDELSNIYNGEVLNFRSGNKQFELNLSSLRVHKVILSSHLEVTINNITREYDRLFLWGIPDRYEINVEFEDTNILDIVTARIKLSNKVAKMRLAESGAITFSFDNNIKVRVLVERCEKKHGRD